MDISSVITIISRKIWSFPFLIAVLGICVFVTLRLRFVQFRYFIDALKMVFAPAETGESKKAGELTSFQAFINTLGANIGNGSLAGIPVAIYLGGPGSIFWLLVMSTFAVALRYAEVYLGMNFIGKFKYGSAKGGPMLYLSMMPLGPILSYSFGFACLGYSIICGNIVQCNAVGLAFNRAWGIDPYYTAFFVLMFIGYVLFGGSDRIVKYLDLLVPFKVGLFVLSSLCVLVYHYQAIPHAFYLIFQGAFSPESIGGGAVGFTLQKVIATGFQRGMFIHEAGLGTAAVAFGATAGKDPAKDSIMSMLSVYINTHVVCLMVGLSVIASGVWNNGETSSALVISAYETVFGAFGGWIITFLVMNFGISVLVSYAYIGNICWSFLTGGRALFIFPFIYAAGAFFGTYMEVDLVWSISDLINATLFVINMIGLLWFTGVIRSGLLNYEKQRA